MLSYTNVTSGDVVTLRSGDQQMTVKSASYEAVTPESDCVVNGMVAPTQNGI